MKDSIMTAWKVDRVKKVKSKLSKKEKPGQIAEKTANLEVKIRVILINRCSHQILNPKRGPKPLRNRLTTIAMRLV